jgi:hypothetical protein
VVLTTLCVTGVLASAYRKAAAARTKEESADISREESKSVENASKEQLDPGPNFS